jgi:predicted esterase
MARMSASSEEGFDVAWDDPLPHALSPTKHYLSPLKKGVTKAVAIFMHGRGDNIHDMVGVFLPVLYKRYGGVEGLVDSDSHSSEVSEGNSSEDVCQVALIGIEARDYSWYPASHNATQSDQVQLNDPFQYSALEKIRQTILMACEATSLPLDRILLVGFSQGANLANTYLQAGLKDIFETQGRTTIPLPGHILALAGSLFRTAPSFPARRYASVEHKEQVSEQERASREKLTALERPTSVIDRLLCGTGDRFFSADEIREAASTLVNDREESKDLIDVQISVGLEPNAPHMITSRMMAATIETIDAIIAKK